jgi:hypothetical protein
MQKNANQGQIENNHLRDENSQPPEASVIHCPTIPGAECFTGAQGSLSRTPDFNRRKQS